MPHSTDRSPLSTPWTRPPRARRWLWAGLGWLLVLVGGIGLFVPILPSTGFFIGAAACFARSYPRWEQWLLNLPRIGPLVRDYRAGYGMPRRAKTVAISMIAVSITLSMLIARPPWFVVLFTVGLGGIGVWYITQRVPTREQVLQQRHEQRPNIVTHTEDEARQ